MIIVSDTGVCSEVNGDFLEQLGEKLRWAEPL